MQARRDSMGVPSMNKSTLRVSASRQGWQGPWEKLALFFQTIRVEHTVFALPFAYLTLALAADGMPSAAHFIWITLAMVGARTVAMGGNRIIDARIDAANPRTASRSLATGRLHPIEAWVFSLAALGLFLGAVYQLSPLAKVLWPAVVAMMLLYPYGKRFTWLCHLGLASVYLMVPTGVWVAVHNEVVMGSVLLGVGAALWVVGFDVLYSCQDVENDRKQGIHSIPAAFGVARGLTVARLMHAGTIAMLAAAGLALEVGPLYYAGVALSAAILAYEHRLVSPRDLSRLNAAFFNMNGIMSIVFFIFVAADVLVR